MEYMLHNQRRTTADADNLNQLNALHRGSEGTRRVHRLIERQTVPLTDDFPPLAAGHLDM
jgi:hypothetical protein